MRLPPALQPAAAALRATLDTDGPRGSAVRAAVRDLAQAAWRAGYPAAQLPPVLSAVLLPALRTRHPGPVGDWLWERIVAWARTEYADAAADAARRPVAGVATDPSARPAPADLPSVYRLDGRDVITRVNAAWRAFAVANGAPALAARAVGTSLWEHVGGAETRRLYGALHATVRRSGRPVTVPFRCDAPAERRWMELTVRPLGGGALQVVSTCVRRAARPPVSLLDPTARRGVSELLMCSWCKRVRVADGAAARSQRDGPAWVDVATVAPTPPDTGVPRLVHDTCPGCAAGIRAVLASA